MPAVKPDCDEGRTNIRTVIRLVLALERGQLGRVKTVDVAARFGVTKRTAYSWSLILAEEVGLTFDRDGYWRLPRKL